MAQSKCIYCNSPNYGIGCAYGPKGKHVHINNGGKCIWCGSSNIGLGCPINPFSKHHVRGLDFNEIIRETTENGITMGYLLNRLQTPFNKWPAFQLGLIDESGKIIKKPETVIERAVLTKSDLYIIRLKSLINEAELSILNNSIYLKKDDQLTTEQLIAQYNLELDVESKIKENISALKKIISEANVNGLNLNTIEKIILKSFINE